jgi:uncharacterized PurR-regulated membrane protein YhhQ (DUF165 family)
MRKKDFFQLIRVVTVHIVVLSMACAVSMTFPVIAASILALVFGSLIDILVFSYIILSMSIGLYFGLKLIKSLK